ncbi:hypothetical protein FRC11_005997 [Ceratobasidium sp. 423]|nr:hypothetical protein FRC11_005997 [Ceratobasidium sp. 423]
MFHRLSLFVVVCSVLFATIANAQFPSCAECKCSTSASGSRTDLYWLVACIGTASPGNCSLTDNACLCQNAAYCNATNTCFKNSCSSTDWKAAYDYSVSLCNQAGVTQGNILNPPTKRAIVAEAKRTPAPAHVRPKSKDEANKQSSDAKASEAVAKAFGYTAASRAFLSWTLELLSISIPVLLEVEKTLGRDLFEELKEAEMKEKSEAARKEQEHGWGGKWGRWAATGGGIILGGVAIGLTGGLAAPALLPLLPFLSASTAPIVLGSLFGVAGGGLAGNRVRKRWGGVERFEFEQIAGGNEDSMAHAKASYAVYRPNGHGSSEGGSTPDKEDSRGGKQTPPSLVATICVPGITLDSEDEGLYAYKDALATTLARPTRDVFVLKHSPDVMLSTGETLNTWIRNKLLTKAGKEVLSRTAFNAVLAAVSLPMTIYRYALLRKCDP